jgi:Ala-tRNA(Pro) deacylase
LSGEDRLYADLAALGIAHACHEHEAVFTVAESSRLHDMLPGAHSKNLFLKDAGGEYWLVTVPADIRVNLKALPGAIGCKRVSFGNADDMQRLLGITPGSVTPLAAINAPPGAIHIVIADTFAQAPLVFVHPLRNTASLGLAGCAILQLLNHWGHAPQIATIPEQDQ